MHRPRGTCRGQGEGGVQQQQQFTRDGKLINPPLCTPAWAGGGNITLARSGKHAPTSRHLPRAGRERGATTTAVYPGRETDRVCLVRRLVTTSGYLPVADRAWWVGAIIMDEHQSPGSDHRSSTKGTTGRAAVCSCCLNARDTEWNCRRKSGNRSGLSIEAIILSYLLFICDHQPSPPFIRKLTHQMFVKLNMFGMAVTFSA